MYANVNNFLNALSEMLTISQLGRHGSVVEHWGLDSEPTAI